MKLHKRKNGKWELDGDTLQKGDRVTVQAQMGRLKFLIAGHIDENDRGFLFVADQTASTKLTLPLNEGMRMEAIPEPEAKPKKVEK